MSARLKSLAGIIIRVIFILLCFILTYLFNALSGFSFGNKASMTEPANVSLSLKNGAEAVYEVKDGKLTVEVIKPGTGYDDITVILTADDIAFDVEYIREKLGKKAEEQKEYLDALEAGPWIATMHYRLTGDTLLTDRNMEYVFIDGALEEYNKGVLSSEANQLDVSGEMEIAKGEGAVAMFVLGTAGSGALPAGKYHINAEVVLGGLVEDGYTLPQELSSSLLFSMIGDALFNTPFTSFFKISSLLTFYGMMTAFGIIFFAFSDIRSSLAIAKAVGEGKGEAVRVTVKTYVDGHLTDSYSYIDDGSSLFAAIVGFVLSYMLFTLTVPIRLIVVIIKDIYHLIVEDYDSDSYSLLGNVLGSIGVYLVVFSLVAFLTLPFWVGIIAIAAGVGLIIPARKLCRDKEE